VPTFSVKKVLNTDDIITTNEQTKTYGGVLKINDGTKIRKLKGYK